MVESDKDQKTEEPTGKRIEDAREEGQLAVSKELSTWFTFIGVLCIMVWFGPWLGQSMKNSLRVFIERPHQLSLEDGGMQDVFLGVATSVGYPATIIFAVVIFTCVVGTMIQTGFYVNPDKIKMDFGKLSPIKGLQNIISVNALVELFKAFLKMVVMGYVAYRILIPISENLPTLVDVPLLQGIAFLNDKVIHIIIILMIIITLIAVADVLYIRYSYFKSLRMTKQEVKDEHKQMEGDPMVKGRLRRIRIEKSRKRMMAKVPKASVVITNPTHYAIALQYERGEMAAPVVVAKGADFIAKRIREIAEENEVPLVSNPPLARALYDTVDLDEPISPEHYKAVAEVISYIYKLKQKK